MKLNIQGRIRNMRLPDGKTALTFSIYEALTNGIQAIEERFLTDSPRNGEILIRVANNSEKTIQSIAITDNGIGLTPRHLESFNECDTMEKVDIGGRGVGRLVWLKAFARVDVQSTYQVSPGNHETLGFQFKPELEDSRHNLNRQRSTGAKIGTTVELSEVSIPGAKLTITAIARGICHHFFPYFITDRMPRTTVELNGRSVDVGQYISTRMSVEKSESVIVAAGVGAIKIDHVVVDPRLAQKLANSILFTAQGRVVESIEIVNKFALRGYLNGKAYTCVISGPFLDEKVDQERTSIKATEEQINAIKEAALVAAEEFLAPHISKVRATQRQQVIALLHEHPQLAISISDVDDYVKSLSPSMSDEEIGKTLFTLLYRHERKVRSQITDLTNGAGLASDGAVNPGAGTTLSETVAKLLSKVQDDAKLRLAEYTIKRHQIIQIARSLLRYSDTEKRTYELESIVHNFICPMGRMLSSRDYDDHNLWLIDDLLSYYQFFASDKSLASLGIEGERKEPDLIFLNPFGFRREGTNDPVVIIEFKRPGDEVLSSDPINQVLGYIEKLRQKTVRDADGAIVSEISAETPFECIVVCDLSEGVRKRFERGLAQHPTPDRKGYYGFSPNHRASIRVISYEKLFRDAELRNKSFFDHLGLLPEEVRRDISVDMLMPKRLEENKSPPESVV